MQLQCQVSSGLNVTGSPAWPSRICPPGGDYYWRPPVASDSLSKFVEAQSPVYDIVLQELCAGRKATHWMWFIFPQLKALGRSAIAKHFGLEGRDEAAAYWRHPVLGPRLRHRAELVAAIQGKTAHQVFG